MTVNMCEKRSDEERQEAKCLWSSLLNEVTSKAKVGLSESKNLVVFGDYVCGKSTLVCRLQGTEDKQEGFGLEYDIIDVKDEAKDGNSVNNITKLHVASANLSVCVMDGNPVQSYLLKYVITDDSIGDQMALIVVSLCEPWKIPEALERWSDLLNKHISKLKLSEETIEACKFKVSKEFYGYTEPGTTTNEANDSIHLASLPTMYAESKVTSSQPSFLNEDESFIKEIHEDNVLNKNLGVPLVVVVTKTDLMKVMIKENQYTEEHFDFIQMHIRRFCLSYGAALFYVSVKEDINCDLLNRYIQHRIYGLPFSQSAYVIEGDRVFIPAGWDSHKKINILGENLTKINPQLPFSTIIPKPLPRKAIHRVPEIPTIDEQAFLLRLSTIKENENIDPNMLKELLGPGGLNSNLSSLKTGPGTKTMDDNNRLPASPTSILRAKIPPGSPINNLPGTASIQGNSDGVLAGFFSNLLKKRPVVNNTTGETPTETQLKCISSPDQTMKQKRKNDTNITSEDTEKSGKDVKTEDTISKQQNKINDNKNIDQNNNPSPSDKLNNSQEHSRPISDQPSVVEPSQTPHSPTDHIDTMRPDDRLDISPNDTNNAALENETNEVHTPPNADSPIVPSHMSPLSGTASDTGITTSLDDMMSENRSDTNHKLPETGLPDNQSENETPNEPTNETNEQNTEPKLDASSPDKLNNSQEHSRPISDQPSVVEPSQTPHSPTDHIDTMRPDDRLDISPNDTNNAALENETNEVHTPPNADSPIVPSHMSPLSGTASDTGITTSLDDMMSENRSDTNHKLPETGLPDNQSENETPNEPTNETNEQNTEPKLDASSPDKLNNSQEHSRPISDQPSVVEPSQTPHSPTDHIDTMRPDDRLDISPNDTNNAALENETNEVHTPPNADSPIVPSHMSPLSGTASDTGITTSLDDMMSENRSDTNHKLPETGLPDNQSENETPNEPTNETNEQNTEPKLDASSPDKLNNSQEHSRPISDQPSVVEPSQTPHSPTDHIDTMRPDDRLDISPNDTNNAALENETNEVHTPPNADSPIVPSHMSPLSGTASDTGITTSLDDMMSENRSDTNHKLPETGLPDNQSENETPNEPTNETNEQNTEPKLDASSPDKLNNSQEHSRPISDQPSVVEPSQTPHSPTDHIDTMRPDDRLDISPNDTNNAALENETNEVHTPPNADSPIVPSHMSPLSGTASDTGITTSLDDMMSENRSDTNHKLPETGLPDNQSENETPNEPTNETNEQNTEPKLDASSPDKLNNSQEHSRPISDQPSVVEPSQTPHSPTDHIDTMRPDDRLDISPNDTNNAALENETNEVHTPPNADSPIVPSHMSPLSGTASDTGITTSLDDMMSENRSDTNHKLPETGLPDNQSENETPNEPTNETNEQNTEPKLDASSPDKLNNSQEHSRPISDQPSVVEPSQTPHSPTDHIDTMRPDDRLDISPNDTNNAALENETNEVHTPPNADSPIVPSHMSPLSGTASDTGITTSLDDMMSENRSDTNHKLPETGLPDNQSENETPNEPTNETNEQNTEPKLDASSPDKLNNSQEHSRPISDQPSVVEPSQTPHSPTDHIDTMRPDDRLDISPNDTNNAALENETNEVHTPPNADSPIVPSHMSPLSGTASDTGITTSLDDMMSENRSDTNHKLPETGLPDNQSENETPNEPTNETNEQNTEPKLDASSPDKLNNSQEHSRPISDQPSVVEPSQTPHSPTDHIDTMRPDDRLDISPNDTNNAALENETNEVHTPPNADSPIVPSHISSANEGLNGNSSSRISVIGESNVTEFVGSSLSSDGTESCVTLVTNQPVSIRQSTEGIKVLPQLKSSRIMKDTIQKSSSSPSIPKLSEKPSTAKQVVTGSSKAPTTAGSNLRQLSNVTNTKTNYGSSSSVSASPNRIRKPLLTKELKQ
ncbi:unnamed protein product [Schistosoma turkestanicum]|nr:unnamed protein product [Schistosoma turkestanicum]